MMGKARETYTFDIDEWEAAAEKVYRLDNRIPGSGHRDEDRLLERYVRDRAWEGDARASALVRMLDGPHRRRWYAP